MFKVWSVINDEYNERFFNDYDKAMEWYDRMVLNLHHSGDYVEVWNDVEGIIEWFEKE